MPGLRRRSLLAQAGLLALGRAAAQTPAAPGPEPWAAAAAQGFAAARLQRLDRFLQAATGASGHLGAVALVARRGEVVHWRAYGHRDFARREPMPRDAIFRIYSMTKPVASVALLMLLEEGRVRLDDSVAQLLPAFAALKVFAGGSADAPQLRPPSRPLTIRHLLTHTAGFATGGPGSPGEEGPRKLLERADPGGAGDLEGFARRVAAAPLAGDPGARFGYDGVNTEVLGRVIEVAGGQRFDHFVQQRILAPLRMADTGFSVPLAQRRRIADLSAVGSDGALVPAAEDRSAAAPGEPRTAYPSAAGGLYSTAADYLRFAQMLLNGGTLDGNRLLGRKTVELMTANHLAHLDPVPGLAPGEGFGLGVSVITDPARRGRLSSAGAYGWSGAASTSFTIDPHEQMIAILLLQHLPRDDRPGELPKHGVSFHNLVYQALER